MFNSEKEKHLNTQMMNLQQEIDDQATEISELASTIGEFSPVYLLDANGERIEATCDNSAIATAMMIKDHADKIVRLAAAMDKVNTEWDALEAE